jgi:hypothetical protein
MLAEPIQDAEAVDPETLRERYEADLADVVSEAGVDRAAEAADIDPARAEAAAAGDAADLTVEEVADLLALSADSPDSEAVLAEVRDHIMLQMSSAVLDVDALEAGLDSELSARDIQQKIEGRQPMTLAEYARIHHFVASENPY